MDYLYDSQKAALYKQANVIVMEPSRKKKIDEAYFKCIFKDSRSFLDFHKPGYIHFQLKFKVSLFFRFY